MRKERVAMCNRHVRNIASSTRSSSEEGANICGKAGEGRDGIGQRTVLYWA